MAGVIDADTHVIESTGMWELMDEALQPRRPVVITTPTNTSYGTTNAMWLIDGSIFPRPGGKGGFFGGFYGWLGCVLAWIGLNQGLL